MPDCSPRQSRGKRDPPRNGKAPSGRWNRATLRPFPTSALHQIRNALAKLGGNLFFLGSLVLSCRFTSSRIIFRSCLCRLTAITSSSMHYDSIRSAFYGWGRHMHLAYFRLREHCPQLWRCGQSPTGRLLSDCGRDRFVKPITFTAVVRVI